MIFCLVTVGAEGTVADFAVVTAVDTDILNNESPMNNKLTNKANKVNLTTLFYPYIIV